MKRQIRRAGNQAELAGQRALIRALIEQHERQGLAVSAQDAHAPAPTDVTNNVIPFPFSRPALAPDR